MGSGARMKHKPEVAVQRSVLVNRTKYNIRKYSFTNRIVNLWNSLPNDTVLADNINIFKNRLDKFWSTLEGASCTTTHAIQLLLNNNNIM